MKDRASKILEAVVREFIDSGEPVSSAFLYEHYDFGIRPAMIRAELSELAEEGYLRQPHHSSGRVPSDRGIEFFASHALQAIAHGHGSRPPSFRFASDDWEDFLIDFSRHCGVVGIVGCAYEEKGKVIHKRGIEYLVRDLLAYAPEVVREAVHDIESIDERFYALEELFPEEDMLEVFIGRKSPLTRSEELGLVVGDCSTRGGRVFVIAVGPKRMDYEKTARVFKNLKHYSAALFT